jgi:hypothetical protein
VWRHHTEPEPEEGIGNLVKAAAAPLLRFPKGYFAPHKPHADESIERPRHRCRRSANPTRDLRNTVNTCPKGIKHSPDFDRCRNLLNEQSIGFTEQRPKRIQSELNDAGLG